MNTIFPDGFDAYACEGDTIEACHDGFRYVATIYADESHGTPWDGCDGHGPVSDWTSRDKLPGELVLAGSRGSKRFYDYAEACKIALRDGWGFRPYKMNLERGSNGLVRFNAQDFPNGPRGDCVSIVTDWHDCENAARSQIHQLHKMLFTPKEYAARAARQDYDVLRAWCDGKWAYCGIAVQVFDANDDEVTGEFENALWGIELNYPGSQNAYLLDVANELASEVYSEHIEPILRGKATIAALARVGV